MIKNFLFSILITIFLTGCFLCQPEIKYVKGDTVYLPIKQDFNITKKEKYKCTVDEKNTTDEISRCAAIRSEQDRIYIKELLGILNSLK